MNGTVARLEGKITHEALAYLRSKVGQMNAVRPWNSRAHSDAIWHFALGVGDDNPMWWDQEYCKTTPWKRMIAPPTFLYSCSSGPRRKGDPSTGSVDEFLPGVLGLWLSDRWHWNRPVHEGEKVTAKRGIHSAEEQVTKFSGRTVHQTEKTVYFGEDGTEAASCYRTIIRIEREAARTGAKYGDVEPATYTQEEIDRINAQYEREPAQRRGAAPRYWDDVKEGEPLITLVKGPLTITNLTGWLMGWGSPMCPTNRMQQQFLRNFPACTLVHPGSNIEDTLEAPHWDAYFARMSGLPGGYDFGGQRISWMAHLMTDWMGDAGFLTDHYVRLRRPNCLGDTLWLNGHVKQKRRSGADALVDCLITATNQRGELVANGETTVKLPTR